MPHIGLCALIVRDYDDAIAFYTDKVGFDLIEDTDMGDGKRWVIVAPTGATETRILLARASGADQENAIGNQTGGRVGFFLNTDDFARDHARMTKAGVQFLEAPRHEPYGTVAVFEDLYGNKWDLLELALQ
ncbi:MAG: VOC family protein [Pseudomonadota bacterium]|uniref:VOC family protein n=1 Tax=Thalassospira sp. TaxID=1912094 RepID=UPI000C3D2151|nr:VOC family protein [Thalassospira sp.]MAL38607.1 extradiol dioxygenase [Thalassospira sp.]MEE3046990.1 VOC family protein [Pseudomonadota bacterium]